MYVQYRATSTIDQDPTEEQLKGVYEEQSIPVPIVKIDNKSDNFATVVSLEFGNELGELLDTVTLSLLS